MLVTTVHYSYHGVKHYELTNHLGNVMVVVTDQSYAEGLVVLPTVVSATDYFPFGMEMVGRSFSSSTYSFGFNTQMESPEIAPGHTTAMYWEYDARIGRRWERDPVVKEWESGYACLGNNPILFSDWFGDESDPAHGESRTEGGCTDYYDAYMVNHDGSKGSWVDNMPCKRINFFMSSRNLNEKNGGQDPALLINYFRASLYSSLSGGQFIAIQAQSAAHASSIVESIMSENPGALIGNVWFDSHGHFHSNTSSFEIGVDYFSVGEACNGFKSLAPISKYCDSGTNVALGSCYAGAPYFNGHKLMKELSCNMNGASVYGSASWVMGNLGLFSGRPASGGGPGDPYFKFEVFRPAWENLGVWYRISSSNDVAVRVNTVSLNSVGQILESQNDYISSKSNLMYQQAVLGKLNKGAMENFYQSQSEWQTTRNLIFRN
jgi:hypothetical protein